MANAGLATDVSGMRTPYARRTSGMDKVHALRPDGARLRVNRATLPNSDWRSVPTQSLKTKARSTLYIHGDVGEWAGDVGE